MDAVDKIIKIIRNLKKLPKEKYDEIWQISGRCVDSETGIIIGNLYPDGINKLNRKQQDKARVKVKGEKSCCRKVEILKKFPFPQYKDTKSLQKMMYGTILIYIIKLIAQMKYLEYNIEIWLAH